MSEGNRTCKNRIRGEYDREIDRIAAALHTVEDTRDYLDGILCYDRLPRNRIKVTLSWGGPADYFILKFDDAGNIVGGKYLFQDWFDGAEMKIKPNDVPIIRKMFEEVL